MLSIKGVEDQEVYVGIRPEGFIPDNNGPLVCGLSRVEVMGRDVSVVCTHESAQSAVVRAIISAENAVDSDAETVRFAVKPGKIHIFSRQTQERIAFEVGD